MPTTDVIIIGAGAAGLSAARALHDAAVDVIVLEARDRMGGRIFTLHDHPSEAPIELGAELIHGRAEPLSGLIDSAGLRRVTINGARWHVRNGRVRDLPDFWGQLDRVMRHLQARPGRDRSFADFLRTRPGGQSLAAERRLAAGFVRGFHAAPPDDVSGNALAAAGSPGDDAREQQLGRLLDGYDGVVNLLAAPVESLVRLSHVVTRVEWQKGRVRVHATRAARTRATVVRARAVLVTVPIGVLATSAGSAGAIEFAPALRQKDGPIAQLAMGAVVRLVLKVSERFWASDWFQQRFGHNEGENLTFLHVDDRDFPVWWTAHPERAPVVVAWCGGPDAARLSQLNAEQLRQHAVSSLAKSLRLSRVRVDGMIDQVWYHDWQHDPFARGAYSYQRVGGEEAPHALARRVQGTVFFAGEATDTEGATGTVHGAIASGRRAARQLLRSARSLIPDP